MSTQSMPDGDWPLRGEAVMYLATSQKAEADRLRRNAARGWPDWARDRVWTQCDYRPSIMDRLRILLSGRLLVEIRVYVDKEIAHSKTDPAMASALFPWERWRLQRQAKRGYLEAASEDYRQRYHSRAQQRRERILRAYARSLEQEMGL